jgi:hypothetical protein
MLKHACDVGLLIFPRGDCEYLREVIDNLERLWVESELVVAGHGELQWGEAGYFRGIRRNRERW